jgi:C3HC4-type zinc finger (RING finger) protein
MPLVFSTDKLTIGSMLTCIILINMINMLTCIILIISSLIYMFDQTFSGAVASMFVAILGVLVCCISIGGSRIKNYNPVNSTDSPVAIDVSAEPIINTVCTTVQPGQMIDNTCQICADNAWQITLRCGHMICKTCLDSLPTDDTDIRYCPFCRAPINLHDATPLFFV